MALLAGGSAAGARQDEEAQAIRSLMQQRGFYPMVAAQRLGEEPSASIKPGHIDPALASGRRWRGYVSLMYWNMDNTTREWANPVTSRTKSQQAQLARYAFDQHWWDLSVQATIAGGCGSAGRTFPAGL